MPSYINRTFAGGEISPSLQVRGDQPHYHTGINLGKNGTVRRDGTIWNRQGTGLISETGDSTKKHRAIDWVFNNNLSYVLELGDFTMRFVKSGVQMTVTPAAYNGATTYVQGDTVEDGGNNFYSVRSGNNGNITSDTFWWYAMPANGVLEIPTPWSEDVLFNVKYDQQGDIVHMVDGVANNQILKRTADTFWVLEDYLMIPDISRKPSFGINATSVAGSVDHIYYCTIVTNNYQESLIIKGVTKLHNIVSLSQTNPVVLNFGGVHGIPDGEKLLILDTGIPELDRQEFFSSNAGPNTVELDDVDGTNFQPYIVGGTANGLFESYVGGTPTDSDPTRIEIHMASMFNAGYRTGDIRYVNIYLDTGEGPGFIGSQDIGIIDGSSLVQYWFYDRGLIPDTEHRPPQLLDPFTGIGNQPSTVQFIQQRLSFGSTGNNPQQINLSRIGFYDNFTTDHLVGADAAIEFILSGRSIEKVEHLVDATNLIVLTQGGEWILNGDENGTIRPTAINAKQIGFEGADKIQPITIGNLVLYMQARSKQLRAIGFNNEIKGFDPTNLTRWAQHLFDFKKVVDWGYQKLPDSVIWMVMDDGTVVSMTFVIQENIFACTRHETQGFYESVCVVPEGDHDIPYFIIRRNINGSDVRTLERLAEREINNVITEAFFMDSFVQFDGTNTTATTQTLSTAGTWLVGGGPFTLTSSANDYVSGDVGNARVLTVGDVTLTCTITAYISPTVVTVEVSKDVPVAFQGVPLTTWGAALTTFSIPHLDTETVTVLADGNAVGEQVVTANDITIAPPAVVVRVGLPYTFDLETLDLEMSGEQTLIDKKKRINTFTGIFKDTRGGWAGPSVDKLYEIKQLLPDSWNTPQEMLVNGRIENIMHPQWQSKGVLYIQQRDPLPMHVLGLVPAGSLGGG